MKPSPQKRSVLRAADLTLSYDRTGTDPIVDGVHFSATEGEIHSIIGPNGSGKTTLLKGLSGYLSPVSGTVTLNGRALEEIPKRKRARRIADLPQDRHAPGSMKVKQLVHKGRYPYRGRRSSQGSKQDEDKIEQALATAGIDELRDRRLDTLSGGQRQLAWLAMVLAQDPDVLLLDEPGTHLDVRHSLRMLNVLSKLPERRGITIVTVLHDLNQAIYLSDRISLMRRGSIFERGTPTEVIREETISEVFDVKVDIIRREGTFLVFPATFGEPNPHQGGR